MSVPTTLMKPSHFGKLALLNNESVHYQANPEELVAATLRLGEGKLNNTGALAINTGKFTGRSPKDKFIVKDELTTDSVDWNEFNIPIEENYFWQLHKKVTDYLSALPEIWVRDCFACADENFRLPIRVVNEKPWGNLFVYNMFIRPNADQLTQFEPEWTIYNAPGFLADPAVDGTRQENFAVVSFKHKTILIGGTGYTGEMKKGIFTILNFILPHQKGVLSMHCSANKGKDGDTAIFFGLSGTGKTTLSADPNRFLIGDDEHAWTADSVFNFEGGCYAKTINLTEEKEPEIFRAIKPGALLENVTFKPNSDEVDYDDATITENTRVSYPLPFISNALEPAVGGLPKNIFFLTCDAYGVLPPISKLSPEQAMYYFISGYTAKVAGTEAGVTEPKATFSACFGAPFLPLHPGKYAAMLGEKMKTNDVHVWLVNTGWSGGAYGTGKRMSLRYTRAMITAALEGQLQQVAFEAHPIFGVMMPVSCPNVPENILNPVNTWTDKQAYQNTAIALAQKFVANFEKYASGTSEAIQAAAPKVG